MNSTADSAGDDAEVLILVGPTASGKTEVGIGLARELDGEIVSADARQVYRAMDIGTAKPTPEEQSRARHHMIDLVWPDQDYSAGRFAQDAVPAIRGIVQRGKRAIVVGGSGLYIRALVDGFSTMPEIPIEVRDRIAAEAQADPATSFLRLKQVDPEAAARLHPNDRQRITRALEVYEASGRPLSEFQSRPAASPMPWPCRWFGLQMCRQMLYDRIDSRVDQMLADGLIDEARGLRERGYGPHLNALKTFGYREVYLHLDGGPSQDQTVRQIKQGTRRYAKRQLTWFRPESRIEWVAAGGEDPVLEILKALDTGWAPR